MAEVIIIIFFYFCLRGGGCGYTDLTISTMSKVQVHRDLAMQIKGSRNWFGDIGEIGGLNEIH